MNREDIIRMAREAGIVYDDKAAPFYERFAKLVSAAEQKKWEEQTQVEINEAIIDEREACAMVCDDKHHTWRWDDEPDSASGPRDCAAAIRARSNA